MAGDYLLLTTDRNLVVVGDPIVTWTALDVTLRFNEPSSGQFTVPGVPAVREQVAAGRRVVVIRDGAVLCAGPIEKWIFERSDDGENAGDGRLTVHFADDLAEIVARQVFPNPAVAPEAQDVDSWTFTGSAEQALRALVDANAGPAALPARRMPQLALGAVAGVGAAVTVATARMEPLGDVARRIAVDGGGIGFRTVQSGAQILFEVYQPVDKTLSVRFSFSLGNMKYIAYEVSSPTATAAIVGGQGEGANRYLLERVDTAGQEAWGRREILVSRPGGDPVATLQADGDKALAEAAETARLPTNVADTDLQRYGVHYGLGDRVAVESWPGEQVTDIVRTVHLQVYPTSGEYVSATVGSQAASSDAAWIRRMREIDARVGRLERTIVPATT